MTMRTALRLSLGALVLFGLGARAGEPRSIVLVETVYPGASVQDVAATVAAPIEQQVSGVEKLLYLSSRCASDGTYTLTVTFKPGIDLDKARVRVQKRVALAVPVLPEAVKQHGVKVKKKSPGVLVLVGLSSPDTSRDTLLSIYATTQIKDELARLPGASRFGVKSNATSRSTPLGSAARSRDTFFRSSLLNSRGRTCSVGETARSTTGLPLRRANPCGPVAPSSRRATSFR